MMEKLKTAAVLMLIGIVSGFLIYQTNNLTEDTIATNRDIQEKSYYFELFGLEVEDPTDEALTDITDNPTDDLSAEVIVYDEDGNIIGYVYTATDKNSYGDVTVLVGVNVDGTIANVIISNSSNTINFVTKIRLDYLGNFAGQEISDVTFDAKTGATYTYTSVKTVIDYASTYYEANRGGADE